MEIWKPIDDYEGIYEVSNYGQVRSLYKNEYKILKQCYGSKGYKIVTLCKKGKQKSVNVHRLVASYFVPNPQSLPCVNHKDENKGNNTASNLEWCSYYYNNVYGNRLTKSATKNSKPVRCIETGIIYSSANSAQRKTNISQSGICQCCNHQRKSAGGFTWEFVNQS